MPTASAQSVFTRTITKAQAEAVKHYTDLLGKPVHVFWGPTYDDGRTEIIVLGQYSPGDIEDPRQFVWSILVNADATEVATSEGQIPEGFSTGIEV